MGTKCFEESDFIPIIIPAIHSPKPPGYYELIAVKCSVSAQAFSPGVAPPAMEIMEMCVNHKTRSTG